MANVTPTAGRPKRGGNGALRLALSKGMPRDKADSFYCRWFIRWISVLISAGAYRAGISANLVSVMSIPLATASFVLLAQPSVTARVVGALVVNMWLILDCVDGTLARINGSHVFGEFLDAVSGYVAMCAFFIGVGVGGYREDPSIGLWAVSAGFTAATANMLLRLTYQKMENASMRGSGSGSRMAARPSRAISLDFHVGISGLGALLVIPAAALGGLRWLAAAYACYYAVGAAGYIAVGIRKTLPW